MAYAYRFDYIVTGYSEQNYIVSMENKDRNCKRLSVYLSTMTVQTALKDHKKGLKQLTRKNVSLKTLRFIFENPRAHTNKGYY